MRSYPMCGHAWESAMAQHVCLICIQQKDLECVTHRIGGRLKKRLGTDCSFPVAVACCTILAGSMESRHCEPVMRPVQAFPMSASCLAGHTSGRAENLQLQQHRPAARRARTHGRPGAALRAVSHARVLFASALRASLKLVSSAWATCCMFVAHGCKEGVWPACMILAQRPRCCALQVLGLQSD